MHALAKRRRYKETVEDRERSQAVGPSDAQLTLLPNFLPSSTTGIALGLGAVVVLHEVHVMMCNKYCSFSQYFPFDM